MKLDPSLLGPTRKLRQPKGCAGKCMGVTLKFLPWTPAEEEIVRARYVTDGCAALAAELGRSKTAVYHRAHDMGLKSKLRWTPADDRALCMLWGDIGTRAIGKRLGRSGLTVYWRAYRLGLPLGCPQGLEYVSGAAKRTGFALETLWMILKWARVSTPIAMSRPIKHPHHHHIVDPLDVDDAIVRWLATETLSGAAERRGMVADTLERILGESGLPIPERPDGKRHWRIPTETIDAAVAKRKASETVIDAARRLGVPRGTLRYWAIRAGLPRPAGKLWLADPREFDRLLERRRAA